MRQFDYYLVNVPEPHNHPVINILKKKDQKKIYSIFVLTIPLLYDKKSRKTFVFLSYS